MHIVVPMSGLGNRFVEAGYTDPKPLIKIDDRTIIEHVIGLFPGETKFSFICNDLHLQTTPMRQVLQKLCPQGQIHSIARHKLGPVYAVAQIFNQIEDNEEVIVNYCDFGTYWDYNDFLDHTRNRKADGAVVAYRGFHPHMLGTTNYAFMRSHQQWMLEIQEKRPFTDDRMTEFASNGTYYFRTGEMLKKYFKKLMDSQQSLNGEYYVSMVYNLLVQDKLKVSLYKIQHMLQWGTPQDVAEYNQWSKTFSRISSFEPFKEQALPNTKLIVPMAGLGSRFQKEGYVDPKPLIEVSGRPMVVQAVQMTPVCESQQFICLQEHLEQYPLAQALQQHYPQSEILPLSELTQGQASTCWTAVQALSADQSILISACDNGMIWNQQKLLDIIGDERTDGLIFSFRNHPQAMSMPQMYGWIELDETTGRVRNVSVKKALHPGPLPHHPIVVGAFWLRRSSDFALAYQKMLKDNIRVNGEFYMDSLMGVLAQMGKVIKEFSIDSYVCWGTPNELKTFEYWQSYFAKEEFHPYDLNNDSFVPKEKKMALFQRIRDFSQEYR